MKVGKVENTSIRAGIEGSNSALKRNGLDKLGVRGITESEIVCGLMTTAQNMNRFIKYKQGGYKKEPRPIGIPALNMPDGGRRAGTLGDIVLVGVIKPVFSHKKL